MGNKKKYWLVNEAKLSDELPLDPPHAGDQVEEGGESHDVGQDADTGHGDAHGQ